MNVLRELLGKTAEKAASLIAAKINQESIEDKVAHKAFDAVDQKRIEEMASQKISDKLALMLFDALFEEEPIAPPVVPVVPVVPLSLTRFTHS
jgi:hypothetical protein